MWWKCVFAKNGNHSMVLLDSFVIMVLWRNILKSEYFSIKTFSHDLICQHFIVKKNIYFGGFDSSTASKINKTTMILMLDYNSSLAYIWVDYMVATFVIFIVGHLKVLLHVSWQPFICFKIFLLSISGNINRT